MPLAKIFSFDVTLEYTGLLLVLKVDLVIKRALFFKTLYLQSGGLPTPKKKGLENIVGKGENSGTQHFLLFHQCFLPYYQNRNY